MNELRYTLLDLISERAIEVCMPMLITAVANCVAYRTSWRWLLLLSIGLWLLRSWMKIDSDFLLFIGQVLFRCHLFVCVSTAIRMEQGSTIDRSCIALNDSMVAVYWGLRLTALLYVTNCPQTLSSNEVVLSGETISNTSHCSFVFHYENMSDDNFIQNIIFKWKLINHLGEDFCPRGWSGPNLTILYGDGSQPYVLKWYVTVFLPALFFSINQLWKQLLCMHSLFICFIHIMEQLLYFWLHFVLEFINVCYSFVSALLVNLRGPFSICVVLFLKCFLPHFITNMIVGDLFENGT